MLDHQPLVVYRFFKEEKYANALEDGELFISTLETCRQYEDPLQGDPEEAYERYNSGSKKLGNGSDPRFARLAANLGVGVDPNAYGITIDNCQSVRRLADAYVLCTTIGFSKSMLTETFGRYCVEIRDVRRFFNVVTGRMKEEWGVTEAQCGPIIYKERIFTGYERSPGPIGFVKPPDKYQSQQEYRFLWHYGDGRSVRPGVIQVPELRNLVRRTA